MALNPSNSSSLEQLALKGLTNICELGWQVQELLADLIAECWPNSSIVLSVQGRQTQSRRPNSGDKRS